MKEIIIFNFVFLLLSYSNSLKPLNSQSQLAEFNQIDLKNEEEKIRESEITINIKKEDNPSGIKIGKKGTLYYMTDYNDDGTNIFNSSDIEEKTSFQTSFIEKDSSKDYNITCRLWKPNHGNLRLFCKLDESLSYGEHFIKINNYTFNYGNHIISINFCFDWALIEQVDYLPFLYSNEQIINIDDEKDSYHLIFNIESYDKEMLFVGGKFFNRKILDNCTIQKKELICEINKEDLIGILPMNGGNLFLYYYWPKNSTINQYPNVLNITVNIKNLQKENIYVGINRLLDNELREDNFVPFETNVTNISNLITDGVQCNMAENENTCFLRKDPDKPLLLLCTGFIEDDYPLKDLINKEIIFDNINVKYNFRIQPTDNTEELEIDFEGGGYIYLTYPKILDFTKKNKYQVHFLFGKKSNDYYYSNLRFLPDLNDLLCAPSNNSFICTIDSDYFENNPNGYYNLYYLKRLKTYSILYEVPPFQVILPKRKTIDIKVKENDNLNPIKIGEKGILYFITNYNDTERNIFNTSDIEEKTQFETMIYDNIKSKMISCRLWKSYNDNIIIICKLNSHDLALNVFKLEKVSFDYNEYTINIFFECSFIFDKRNYEIPFLYSDKQIIDIKDDIESYNLKFKIEAYNNELLYLYGEVNNFLILDKCKTNEKELNCEISKQKLEEILVKNNEQFRVESPHGGYLLKFTGVSNIIINHKISKKEDIYIGITGPLTNESSINLPFGFKTNVTNIPNIHSDIQGNCYFKKFNENPLLFLCRLDKYPKERIFKFGNITNEMILNNLHYKYNFRIQPFEPI